MFRLFATGLRLHRFAAELHADHVLPTTITDLQKRYGVTFARTWTKVRNRFGTDTRVMLYWLEGDDLKKARQLIGLEQAAP